MDIYTVEKNKLKANNVSVIGFILNIMNIWSNLIAPAWGN